MNNIFKYTNYQLFLSDEVKKRKEQNVHFTYRFIARELKLASPGFFNWIISGKRKLPEAQIPALVKLLKLSENEAAYFTLLVRYNHSTDLTEREELFEKLSLLQKKQTRYRLPPEQHELFAAWHYLAILELLRMFRFKDDYHALAAALRPKIRIPEAREAIRKLEKLGLITRDDDGCYHPTELQLSTGGVWESERITTLQAHLADLGSRSVLGIPRNERNISNVTLCLSEKSKARIVREIIAFRRKIIAISEIDKDTDTVFQCNIQLFPLSSPVKGR